MIAILCISSCIRYGYGMMGSWPPISPLLSPYGPATTFNTDGQGKWIHNRETKLDSRVREIYRDMQRILLHV